MLEDPRLPGLAQRFVDDRGMSSHYVFASNRKDVVTRDSPISFECPFRKTKVRPTGLERLLGKLFFAAVDKEDDSSLLLNLGYKMILEPIVREASSVLEGSAESVVGREATEVLDVVLESIADSSEVQEVQEPPPAPFVRRRRVVGDRNGTE